MKRVDFSELVPGKRYHTICGVWDGITTFVGAFQVGKRTKYRFTFGDADNWENQFGHYCLKSEIKVYEEV